MSCLCFSISQHVLLPLQPLLLKELFLVFDSGLTFEEVLVLCPCSVTLVFRAPSHFINFPCHALSLCLSRNTCLNFPAMLTPLSLSSSVYVGDSAPAEGCLTFWLSKSFGLVDFSYGFSLSHSVHDCGVGVLGVSSTSNPWKIRMLPVSVSAGHMTQFLTT